MNLRIKATDYEMTPETEEYVARRVQTLEKLLGESAHSARCEVEVGKDAGRPRHGANMWFAEIHIIFPGGSAYARNNSESINGAIDDVKEEVERQLRKGKRLHVRMIKRGGAFAKRLLKFGRE